MIINCLQRGLLCASSYSIGTVLTSSPLHQENLIAMSVYGALTFPVIFYNFKFTRRLPLPSWLAATINECVLWPLNTLPVLYALKHVAEEQKGVPYDGLLDYQTNVLPVTIYSAVFWVPFTTLQYKYPLHRFAPVRFTAGFLYNIVLSITQNKNTL